MESEMEHDFFMDGNEETKHSPDMSGVGEIREEFFRSGGKGGQNVNKVETGVRVRAKIEDPMLLERLREIYPGAVTDGGEFFVEVTQERSQLQNRDIARKRFTERIATARETPKARIATKPSRAKRERRLKEKRLTSERKRGRERVTESE